MPLCAGAALPIGGNAARRPANCADRPMARRLPMRWTNGAVGA